MLVDFSDIDDVRRGWKTDLFNVLQGKIRSKKDLRFSTKRSPKVQESLCFSIILTDYSTVDLIAETEDVLEHWIQLRKLSLTWKTWLKGQFKKADINNSGSLDFLECLKLLKQLNILMSKFQAKFLFDEANDIHDETDAEGQLLSTDEFINFYHSLIQRLDIEALFKKYSGTTMNVLGPEDLMRFLHEEQGMKETLEECKSIIEIYQPDQEMLHGYLSLKGFQEFLLSPEFDIFNKNHLEISQDMNQPLSHYFIASSHNTYLIDDQLVGSSSVEGYVKALLKGCRCVELDCWDGSDGEPIIYHGHTLTSKILFRDVLDAIKLYAFKASVYPLILSIENHCSYEYQKIMASHLCDILGDLLYKVPVTEEMTMLPSPEQLKKKIIVKAKRLKVDDSVEGDDLIDEASSSSSSCEGQSALDTSKVYVKHLLHVAKDSITSSTLESLKELSVAEELSNIVNVCQSNKFKTFAYSQKYGKCYHISSYSETKAINMCKKQYETFIIHNNKFLSRIYPSGVRTDSSNYDPIPMWNAGCQIVAFNYQTPGQSMRLNDAMFMPNGGCGYILKPEYMRQGTLIDHKEYMRKQKKILHIKIISGQHIPKPGQSSEGEIVDPYVKIIIRGKHMEDKEECKTKYIKNNGFNPVWNEEFDLTVNFPETCMMEVLVKDNCTAGSNEYLGGYVLPFKSISEGYRNIFLKDANGIKIPMATLFVHIKIFEFEDV
ncbi:1-phosphatidylinositol 4,5-bisphosphate phosphodiesterase delta-4 [Nymphon striatum]|nr:1-phosphatidylinositol 4,5-bisphosphate phosphodiesterase delta-4 [Nymphon striatum]